MSNTKIKKLDLSQIRYTPQDGEIVQNVIDECFYIYKDDEWKKICVEGSGLSLNLYDLNKQIIGQLPTLTAEDLEKKAVIVDELHEAFHNGFYLLYGKELSYFTLFKIEKSKYFAQNVFYCLNNIGNIKAIDWTEPHDAIEIWVQEADTDPTCLYLFPYDTGIVPVEGELE